MDGIATAIVGFIFVCIIFPRLIKKPPQYYAALALVLIGMLLHGLAVAVNSPSFIRFVGAMNTLLQAGSIILLVLATGGLTLHDLASDLVRSYEVIRRGETEKEIIIPIGDQKPRVKEEEEPVRYAINTPRPTSDDEGSIPVEDVKPESRP